MATAEMMKEVQVKLEPLDPSLIPQAQGDSNGVQPPKKTPKKRGRPKKIKDPESGDAPTAKKQVKKELKQELITDGAPVKKKRERFKGTTEEEVLTRKLPDHLDYGLDIVIVGINPGLVAAYTGHYFAGPGNHFWKCLFLSGLIPHAMNAYDDRRLMEYGIGFTNIVERTSRGSADLTKKEIQEGAEILKGKIRKYKPKIAVFNGKGIYEIFCGRKDFIFGRQPEPFPDAEETVGINPGLTAAYTGHHYSGPGNHFWKCLFMSGLIPTPMNAYDDYKLLHLGIGFTNIVERTTRGSGDLSKKEIQEGAVSLTEKMKLFKPKIAVFNGKGIYEIFVGHKNFIFGRQPDTYPNASDTHVFVMPNSSARCSQLPRAVDKLPFYTALKKWRDFLRGDISRPDESEVTFPDLQLKVFKKEKKPEGEETNTQQTNQKGQTPNLNAGSQRLTSQHHSLIKEAMMMSDQDMAQPNPDWNNSMGQYYPNQQQQNVSMHQQGMGMHQPNNMGQHMNQQCGNPAQRNMLAHHQSQSQGTSPYFQGQNQFGGAMHQPYMQRPPFFARVKSENLSPTSQESCTASSGQYQHNQRQSQGQTGLQRSFEGNYSQNQGYHSQMGQQQIEEQMRQRQISSQQQWQQHQQQQHQQQQQQQGFNQQQNFQGGNMQQQQQQQQQQQLQQGYGMGQGHPGQNNSYQGYPQQGMHSQYIKQEPGVNQVGCNSWNMHQGSVQNQGQPASSQQAYFNGQWNSQMNKGSAYSAHQGNPQQGRPQLQGSTQQQPGNSPQNGQNLNQSQVNWSSQNTGQSGQPQNCYPTVKQEKVDETFPRGTDSVQGGQTYQYMQNYHPQQGMNPYQNTNMEGQGAGLGQGNRSSGQGYMATHPTGTFQSNTSAMNQCSESSQGNGIPKTEDYTLMQLGNNGNSGPNLVHVKKEPV